MVSFESDYIAGAHPQVLTRLAETNLESLPGYGTDPYCERAKAKIRQACQCPGAQVEFLVGGTQTNAVVISTMLQDYEGVIAAGSGHVSTHEAGAIEFTGHEVLELPQTEGKLQAAVVGRYLEGFYQDANHEHMTFPGMVYISFPTELGTLYTKQELEGLAHVCQEYHIPLYIDGARLGYGLMSPGCDLTLPDIARLADVFYIGGTKVGALCGEAVVFTRNNRPPHFMTSLKRRGGLLAKGRLLGVQFDALFTDGLYFEISRHAMKMAAELKAVFRRAQVPLYAESPTNQQFILLEDGEYERLQRHVRVSFWEKPDAAHTAVRLATSWSTTYEDLEALEKALAEMRM